MVKQERARRTREKVLDAAAEEFAVEGYSKATLGGVVERTGMTKGALYGHFPSKRALAGALMRESRDVWEAMRPDPDASGADARAELERLVLDLAHRLRVDIRMRAALRLAGDCSNLARSAPHVFEDVQAMLVTLVGRAQEEGAMAPHPPELVAQLLMTALHGVVHMPDPPVAAAGSRAALWPDDVWKLLLDVLFRTRDDDVPAQ
jgi:AcrR family transcriptional regulator